MFPSHILIPQPGDRLIIGSGISLCECNIREVFTLYVSHHFENLENSIHMNIDVEWNNQEIKSFVAKGIPWAGENIDQFSKCYLGEDNKIWNYHITEVEAIIILCAPHIEGKHRVIISDSLEIHGFVESIRSPKRYGNICLSFKSKSGILPVISDAKNSRITSIHKNAPVGSFSDRIDLDID